MNQCIKRMLLFGLLLNVSLYANQVIARVAQSPIRSKWKPTEEITSLDQAKELRISIKQRLDNIAEREKKPLSGKEKAQIALEKSQIQSDLVISNKYSEEH